MEVQEGGIASQTWNNAFEMTVCRNSWHYEVVDFSLFLLSGLINIKKVADNRFYP